MKMRRAALTCGLSNGVGFFGRSYQEHGWSRAKHKCARLARKINVAGTDLNAEIMRAIVKNCASKTILCNSFFGQRRYSSTIAQPRRNPVDAKVNGGLEALIAVAASVTLHELDL